MRGMVFGYVCPPAFQPRLAGTFSVGHVVASRGQRMPEGWELEEAGRFADGVTTGGRSSLTEYGGRTEQACKYMAKIRIENGGRALRKFGLRCRVGGANCGGHGGEVFFICMDIACTKCRLLGLFYTRIMWRHIWAVFPSTCALRSNLSQTKSIE
jgi:hypothetical protein